LRPLRPGGAVTTVLAGDALRSLRPCRTRARACRYPRGAGVGEQIAHEHVAVVAAAQQKLVVPLARLQLRRVIAVGIRRHERVVDEDSDRTHECHPCETQPGAIQSTATAAPTCICRR
jgi:hypothetical protein